MNENKINSGVRKSRLSGSFFKAQGDGADSGWLGSIASNVFDKIKNAGRDIANYLKSVVGGAKVVLDKVLAGDWNFFKTWFKEAPLLPKIAGTGAALLTGAVLLFAGGAVVGSIAGGIKASLAALGFWKIAALSTMMPTIMGSVLNAGEWAYNFDWAVPDKSIIKQCKEAINRIYEPLGDALGTAAAAIVAGRFGKAFSPPTIDTDMTLLACYCLINPSIEDTIIDAMSDLMQSVKSIGYEILFLQSYKGIRKIVGDLTGNDDWGKEGNQPFVISQKVQDAYTKLKASEYLGHITEEQWEGIESFGESFYDTLKDLLTDEDTYINWNRR